MSNGNQLVNMKDVQEKITEQIKVSLFNMMPEDKLQSLVQQEIDAFFEPQNSEFWVVKNNHSHYRSNDELKIASNVSPFRLIVWNHLRDHLESQLDEIFNSKEFVERCRIGDGEVKEDIQKATMYRQESIALGMATMLFDRMIGESLTMGIGETKTALQLAVRNVLMEMGEL